MNAGQHLGNTKLILKNLGWHDVSFNPDLVKYFQVLNWLPDYVSLIDLIGKLVYAGFIDYIPIYLPFLGWPSFNFFSIKKKITDLAKNTIIDSEEKIFHKFHFDSLTSFNKIIDHWKWLEEIVKNYIELLNKETDETIKQHMIIALLAESLHAVQDFYSHSNWIEVLYNEFNFNSKEEFPTWFDIFEGNTNENSIYKDRINKLLEDPNILFTGYFPLGKDKKLFSYYHNDKGNKPGINKDRSERPFFEVVYYLAYKNGIQWLNYIKNKYLDETHIKLLNKPLSDVVFKKVLVIQPYVKTISYKLREWNGLRPFENLSLDVSDPINRKNILHFTVKISTTEQLVKYDRDFRKSFFNIFIKINDKILLKSQKFGKKSGITNFKLKLDDRIGKEFNSNLSLRVEYGLLYKEKLIIKEY